MTHYALEVPTKSSVRKAGDKLKDSSLDHTEALDVLSAWRALHSYPINTFQATLRGKVESLGLKKAIIAQRLKRLPSIKDVYALYDNLLQSNRRFEHEPQLPPRITSSNLKTMVIDAYTKYLSINHVFTLN